MGDAYKTPKKAPEVEVELHSQIPDSPGDGYFSEFAGDDPTRLPGSDKTMTRRRTFPSIKSLVEGIEPFDWNDNLPGANIGTLALRLDDASYAVRGQVERTGPNVIDRESMRVDPLYQDLFLMVQGKTSIDRIIDNIITGDSDLRECSRVFDAFTEYICEGHDKTHIVFLMMNLDRITEIIEMIQVRRDMEGPKKLKLIKFANELEKIFRDKFNSYLRPSACQSVSQDRSRAAIDACSLLLQNTVMGPIDTACSTYLCDIDRSKGGTNVFRDAVNPEVLLEEDDDIRSQVVKWISRGIKYVIPDACDPKKEGLSLIKVFAILALCDAAEASLPLLEERCLFLILQSFFNKTEYDSFFEGTQIAETPQFEDRMRPYTVTSAFECGGDGPLTQFPIKETYIHETNAGGFQFAFFSCIKWKTIRDVAQRRIPDKDRKELMAPLVFVYYGILPNHPRINELKEIAEQFRQRAMPTRVIPKIAQLKLLCSRHRLAVDNIVSPTPLPYYIDERGVVMILSTVWDTAGSSLSNNGSLGLTKDDPRVTLQAINVCIRGDQDNASCGRLLEQVLISIIETTDTLKKFDPKLKDEIIKIIRKIRSYCGLDLKEVMDRTKGRCHQLIKLLTGMESLLITVDVCLAKSLCHLMLCLVRHSEVLSCYGQLNTELSKEEKQKIVDLQCMLIQKGFISLQSVAGAAVAASDPQALRVMSLKKVHDGLKTEMAEFHEGILRKWNDGIESFTKPTTRPAEVRLFDLLYFMATYQKLAGEESLLCKEDDFVKAFSSSNSRGLLPKSMLLKKFLGIEPRILENFHALNDSRSKDWTDKLISEQTTDAKFNDRSKLFNQLWDAAGKQQGITDENIKMFIAALPLGELCVEIRNLNKALDSWPGISLNRTTYARIELAPPNLKRNKKQIMDLFIPVFTDTITAFLQRNCFNNDGTLPITVEKIIEKAFSVSGRPYGFDSLDPRIKAAFFNLGTKPLQQQQLLVDCTLSDDGGTEDDNDHVFFDARATAADDDDEQYLQVSLPLPNPQPLNPNPLIARRPTTHRGTVHRREELDAVKQRLRERLSSRPAAAPAAPAAAPAAPAAAPAAPAAAPAAPAAAPAAPAAAAARGRKRPITGNGNKGGSHKKNTKKLKHKYTRKYKGTVYKLKQTIRNKNNRKYSIRNTVKRRNNRRHH